MFLLRMVFRSFSRQLKRRLLIAVTVCLSATICVAMLGVVFDVGDKLNAELSTYGSNIVVRPKADAVVSDLYNTADAGNGADTSDPTSFLKESDVPNIKTTFWAFNITDFAPQLNVSATIDGRSVPVTGTWFDKKVPLATGQSVTAGVKGMRSWWKVDGAWAKDGSGASGTGKVSAAADGANAAGKSGGNNSDEQAQSSDKSAGTMDMNMDMSASGDTAGKSADMGAMPSMTAGNSQGAQSSQSSPAKSPVVQGMMGKDLANATHTKVGQAVTLSKATADGQHRTQRVRIVGIYDSGDNDANGLYIPSWSAQRLSDLPDSIDKIEVKALTTPENDLARKAEKDPAALSQEEWETWYCTAYPSSIAYQIEEVMPDAVAKQVRQVAALQGDVLRKTQAVMILMTALSLIAAAIAVANLMAASIGERGSELALLKAIGATDGAVSRLMLTETAVISLIGGLVGAGLGSLLAQVIGHVVFGSGVVMRPMVFVLVFVLLAVTILIASFSSIRSILHLRPAEVLHGR
ncbi:FtsX-like permease family protein [Bifidobacterium sp. ESL0790]|uniref:ABC transporter permease n=1 Tax=Bifidobacterium sp. ESL0790 TaxID=2983233 RepID=UPI0023F6ED6E|nr:FtsX-like permease family protein [Bifidobacterium sp. ESL0790]WEV72366.1 FtsX-like permease family protein [Bifidobacterium sp. ESL0790]